MEKAFLTWDPAVDFSDIDNLTDIIIEILSSNDIMMLTKQLHPRTVDDMDVNEKDELNRMIDNHEHYGPTYLQYLSSTSAIDVEEIIRIGLVLQHNGFQSGLYSQQSLFNHSCDPNCIKLSVNGIHGHNYRNNHHKKLQHSDNNQNHDDNDNDYNTNSVPYQHQHTNNRSLSEIWSIKPIALGEELTISYYHPIESASECVRLYLRNNHKFICRCKRCELLLYSCRSRDGDDDDDDNQVGNLVGPYGGNSNIDSHCHDNHSRAVINNNSHDQLSLSMEMELEQQLLAIEDSIPTSSSFDGTSEDPMIVVAELMILLDQIKDFKHRFPLNLIFIEMMTAQNKSINYDDGLMSRDTMTEGNDSDGNNKDQNRHDNGEVHVRFHDRTDGSSSSDTVSNHSPISVLMRSRIYKIERSIILSYLDVLQRSNSTNARILLPPPLPQQHIIEQLLQCLLEGYLTYLQYLHYQHPTVGIILDDIAEASTLLLNKYPNSFRTTFKGIDFMDILMISHYNDNNDIDRRTDEKLSSQSPTTTTTAAAVTQQEQTRIVISETQSLSPTSSVVLIKRFIDQCRRRAKSIRSLFHSFTRYPCTVSLLTSRAGSFYWGKRRC